MKEITSIMVRDNLTFAQFGCHEEYFEKHIKGKVLNVVDQQKDKFLIVEDSQGETWSIFTGDYIVANQLALYNTEESQDCLKEENSDFHLNHHCNENYKRKAG